MRTENNEAKSFNPMGGPFRVFGSFVCLTCGYSVLVFIEDIPQQDFRTAEADQAGAAA
jgi:hypothetical protein